MVDLWKRALSADYLGGLQWRKITILVGPKQISVVLSKVKSKTKPKPNKAKKKKKKKKKKNPKKQKKKKKKKKYWGP